MSKVFYDLNKEQIIVLIFVLTLATCSFFVSAFFPDLDAIIKQVLFYFGFFGFIFILATILIYYITKANNWLNENKLRLVITIAVILALSHALFIGLDNHSWYSFLGYLMGDGLIILLSSLGYSFFTKIKGKQKPSRVLFQNRLGKMLENLQE